MTGQEIVPKFMCHAEADKSFILNVRGIHDTELVSDLEETSRDTRTCCLLGLHHNVVLRSNNERINRKSAYAKLCDKTFCMPCCLRIPLDLAHPCSPGSLC